MDEVFSTDGIIPILRKYDIFIEMYVIHPNTAVPLPPKITRDRVVDSSAVRSWVAYRAPPLLVAFIAEVCLLEGTLPCASVN